MSWTQFNDLWRNLRLTITAIIIPVIGILIVLYINCKPFHNWVDEKLNYIFNKNKKKEI